MKLNKVWELTLYFKTKNPLRSLLRGNIYRHVAEYRELKETEYYLTQYARRSGVLVCGCLKSYIMVLTLKSVLFEWHTDTLPGCVRAM